MSKKLQRNNPDFWQNVSKDEDGHWRWRGVLNSRGYGIFRGKGAHRVLWGDNYDLVIKALQAEKEHSRDA